jgi:Flp pilus assembly protein TadG
MIRSSLAPPVLPTKSEPRRGKQSESGAALVEFALIAFLMLMILAGIVDYAMFIQAAFQVQEAAAAGAQYSAIPGNQDLSVAANLAATQYWTTYAQSGSTTGVSNFQVTATNIWRCTPSGGNVSYSATCSGYGTPVEYVQVTTQGSFAGVLMFPGIPASLTVNGVAVYPVPWTQPAG